MRSRTEFRGWPIYPMHTRLLLAGFFLTPALSRWERAGVTIPRTPSAPCAPEPWGVRCRRRSADWKSALRGLRFMGSLHGLRATPLHHEPSVKRVSARASWTAATESSESPLWVGVAVSAASFGVLSAAKAKAVTSRTPSPQSKTWRQIRRFMGRENSANSRRGFARCCRLPRESTQYQP